MASDHIITKASFKKYFEQYIGLPFLLVIGIILCTLDISPRLLLFIIFARIAFSPVWGLLKAYIILLKLQSICNSHIQEKFLALKDALKKTKLQQDTFRFKLNHLQTVYLLVNIDQARVAIDLINRLQMQEKIENKTLNFLKVLLTNFKLSSTSQTRDVNRCIEKLANEICHYQMSTKANNKGYNIPQEWVFHLQEFTASKKLTPEIIKVFRKIQHFTQITNQQYFQNSRYEIPKQPFLQFCKNISELNLTCNESARGLANLGCTCYMNSALQCLHKTFELTSAIKRAKCTPFVKAYLQLMEELSKNINKPFHPTEVKRLIGQYNPLFDDYSQHDSGELMETVLNFLNNDLNEVTIQKNYEIDPNIERTDQQLFQQYQKKWGFRQLSKIEDLFFGSILTVYKCKDCGGQLKLFQKFNVLFLPVIQSSDLSLTSCMNEFLKVEILEGENSWWCNRCNTFTKTSKIISVFQNSPILIICFKRFNGQKKCTREIPFEKQITLKHISNRPNVQEAVYDLYGVINHAGSSIHFGHYYSYCYDGVTWKEYDDQRVTQLKQSEIVTSEALVLLYRLKK